MLGIRTRPSAWLPIGIVAGALAISTPLPGQPRAGTSQQASAALARYCATCHSSQVHTAGLTIDPAAVCVDEKALLGSYSASFELQEESVRFVMNREMDLERLISHRFPLESGVEALNLAAHPQPDSMKIVIQPGSTWEGHQL